MIVPLKFSSKSIAEHLGRIENDLDVGTIRKFPQGFYNAISSGIKWFQESNFKQHPVLKCPLEIKLNLFLQHIGRAIHLVNLYCFDLV